MKIAVFFILAAGASAFADGFTDPADVMLTDPPVFDGTFKLSSTLQDHMVLQRAPASAVVWGFAVEGTIVTTTFAGKSITSTADNTTVWRASLPPTPASEEKGGQTISFSASTGEKAALSDVLFGDVFVCGGQSNMQFSLGGNVNASAYRQEANKYGNIRLITVGQKTSSKTPLLDLQTIEQAWAPASNTSVSDGSKFNYFSAVCWFFGWVSVCHKITNRHTKAKLYCLPIFPIFFSARTFTMVSAAKCPLGLSTTTGCVVLSN